MESGSRRVWEYIQVATGVRGDLVVLRFWGSFAHWHYRLTLDALAKAKIEPATTTWDTKAKSGEVEIRFNSREVTTDQAVSVVHSAIETSGLGIRRL